MNVDTDKARVVAVFYHEDTKTYNDYDLIVNMVFKDGSTKTAIAKGVASAIPSSPQTKCFARFPFPIRGTI